MVNIDIRILETPEELKTIEDLQRIIWPGNETEIVPVHIFRACIHNGGLVLGAYHGIRLIGFVFGFPGFEYREGSKNLIHASHMAGVHPEYRNAGIGYKLKRAQWQLVRAQGIERITWTYDPLQSRNANLNISKLGAVCNTYIPNYYGEMRDELNAGMPSDRFQVDWWLNSSRVKHRLSTHEQRLVDPLIYLSSGIPLINHTLINESGFITPRSVDEYKEHLPMLLLEIPADIKAIKQVDLSLAVHWSYHIRKLFLNLFNQGYITTDFIYISGKHPRSFYILTDGDATF